MITVFLDMRTEKEVKLQPKDGGLNINIPFADVLKGKLNGLDLFPKNSRIEFYYPLGWLVINTLNKRGFFNVVNLGNI